MKNKISLGLAIILSVAAFLTGCSYPVPKDLWDKASSVCDNLGGIYSLEYRGKSRSGEKYFFLARCKQGVIVEGTASVTQ